MFEAEGQNALDPQRLSVVCTVEAGGICGGYTWGAGGDVAYKKSGGDIMGIVFRKVNNRLLSSENASAPQSSKIKGKTIVGLGMLHL